MQASDRVLARRYALALYQTAVARKEQGQVREDLSMVVGRLSDKMARYKHPRISAKEKRSMLEDDLEKSTAELTLRFLGLLIDKKRFGLLPLAADVFGELCDEGNGIVHAKVRASHELSGSEAADLAARLGARAGKKVELNVKVEESLLAGVVVRMGDWVFDASLKGELERMRDRLSTRN